MTQAQKTAKEKFKKAIEYRKKTGVSLKEAFAHVYGKKVGAIKKKSVKKKAVKKVARPSRSKKKVKATYKVNYQTGKSNRTERGTNQDAKRKALAPGKRKSASGKTYYETRANRSDFSRSTLTGVKKHKKSSEQSILNKIHKVKDDVNKLDEAQHKHMMSGIEDKMFKDLYDLREKIANTKKAILKLQGFAKLSPPQKHIFINKAKQYKKYLIELNTHYRELKKHI
jgi:hypothetical protein